MRKPLVSRMLATAMLIPALAAGQQAPQPHWVPPKCEVKPGNRQVNSALSSLKDAAETRFDDRREKDLQDANRLLTEALTTGGQEQNGAAWYFLARYYVVRNDAAGADSAFRRSVAILPACHEDITYWRRNGLWVAAYNEGVNALNAQQYDSAVAAFRRAILAYPDEPTTFTTLATAYYNAGRSDSAARYFRLAANAMTAPKDSSSRKDAMFNLANAFYLAKQYDSAAAGYADYLKSWPNDPQALTRLGDVLAAGGHQDSAMAVYRSVIAHGDSIDPLSLINVGVSVYNAAPPWPDTAAMSATCRNDRRAGRTLTAVQRRTISASCDSTAIRAMKDRDAAARVNYQMAAQSFEAALRRDTLSRDGLFNVANTYLALRDTARMLAAAQRLVTVDPMNRTALRLVAQGWQLRGMGDSALHYVILADSLLPVEISISSFNPGDSSTSIGGLATNFHETPSQMQKVVFEFFAAGGASVATETLEVPTLDAGGVHPFQVRVAAPGIVAWRYHRE